MFGEIKAHKYPQIGIVAHKDRMAIRIEIKRRFYRSHLDPIFVRKAWATSVR